MSTVVNVTVKEFAHKSVCILLANKREKNRNAAHF